MLLLIIIKSVKMDLVLNLHMKSKKQSKAFYNILLLGKN